MREVNPSSYQSRFLRIRGVWIACALALVLCGCASDEDRAREMFQEGTRQLEAGDPEAALNIFEAILKQYPETETAAYVRDHMGLYRGLTVAIESYDARRARDLLVRVARAVERYRLQQGRYPSSLDALAPRWLDSVPKDPWGRPFIYERRRGGRGYRLACLGSDGVAGGEADAADFVIEDGDFKVEGVEP